MTVLPRCQSPYLDSKRGSPIYLRQQASERCKSAMQAMQLSRPQPVAQNPLAAANKALQMLKAGQIEGAGVLRI